MSEIPYYFETPVPKYFRENGWFEDINTVLFITWAFSKCSAEKRTVRHDSKSLTLEPFEFITGRASTAKACLLTEDALKHQLKMLLNAGFLKKTPNSTPNRFTCYVWVTSHFLKNNAQLNPHLSANCAPTERPQSRYKNKRYKKSHHPYPSSSPTPPLDDEVVDDLSSKFKDPEQNPQSPPVAFELLVNGVKKTVTLTKEDLDACIAIKGSLQSVESAIAYVMRCPGRKSKIYDWPNVMRTWKIRDDFKSAFMENLSTAERLERDFFPQFTNGWRCSIIKDSKKDCKLLQFEPNGPGKTHEFDMVQAEFKEKVNEFMRKNGVQKGRIT